ncbi:type-1A angiotensin II receptor-like [Octopus vulgaris]|uniref:Type-1A angiotensin II receptor-like n=1 Tax=Octopus vulgaris TaxID=6645 RepID=A0AA36F358_OCTVU|nr:type-1A angiotensin II receptor-like [Octopus vulgaris]
MDKFMVFFTCTSSELTLLIISLERYNKVCRFNKYQLKIRHAKISAIIINIIAILVSVPPILYFDRIDYRGLSIFRRKAEQRFREKSISLRKNDQKDFRRTFSEKRRRSRRVNSIIASITVLFVISFIPCLLLGITYPLLKNIKLSVPVERLKEFGIRLWILNSSLNPVVYGMLNARFRNEFLKILKELFNIKIFKTTSTTDSTLEDSS